MAYNIEKVAKETILLFFLETTEPHLGKFTEEELTQISRWLSKITRLDLYSMRTHLLLLYHVLKRGQLLPPFDKDPATITLPRFRGFNSYIDVDDPHLDRVLNSVTQCSAHASRRQPESAPAAGARRSRRDVFHIPCRRQAQDQPAPDQEQTFAMRSRSQPRYQGDFDEPAVEAVEEKRSRSVPRIENQQEAACPAACPQEQLDPKCCPPGFDPQAAMCPHSMCRPCQLPDREQIGLTSTFYEEDFHMPDFPVSPIRGGEAAGYWQQAEINENRNSCVHRSRIPVAKGRCPLRVGVRTESRMLESRIPESRIPVRTTNPRYAKSSRLQSGITLVILSPVAHSSSNTSSTRRSSIM